MFYMSPSWFYGFDIAFELVFGVISLVIALLAFKIYRKSFQISARLLGFSFVFISLAFLVLSFFNLLFSLKPESYLCQSSLCSVAVLSVIGLYTHIILLLIGFVILCYIVLKRRSITIFLLLLGITLFAIIFSKNVLLTYHLLSSIFLAFISWCYIRNFLANKQTKTCLIALAFTLLFFGSFHFFLAVNHALFYVMGHFFELFAYILILMNFYLVLKNDE